MLFGGNKLIHVLLLRSTQNSGDLSGSVCLHTAEQSVLFSEQQLVQTQEAVGSEEQGMMCALGSSSESQEASSACSSSQHHWSCMSSFHGSPLSRAAGFWQGTDSHQNLEFQLRIKSEQPWLQPRQSVPWATPAWHKEGAQWGP